MSRLHDDGIAREIVSARHALEALERSLRRLTPLLSAGVALNDAPKENGEHRRPRLSPKARASMVLQGRYMGFMRQLRPRQKAQVRKIRATKGVTAAIQRAREMTRS